MVKNMPSSQDIWIQSLGWEDPLEIEMSMHSSILGWYIPWSRGAWGTRVHGVPKESDTT